MEAEEEHLWIGIDKRFSFVFKAKFSDPICFVSCWFISVFDSLTNILGVFLPFGFDFSFIFNNASIEWASFVLFPRYVNFCRADAFTSIFTCGSHNAPHNYSKLAKRFQSKRRECCRRKLTRFFFLLLRWNLTVLDVPSWTWAITWPSPACSY